MKKLLFYFEKYKIVISISCLLLFILIGTLLYINNNQKTTKIEMPIKQEKNKKDEKYTKIKVDVKGMVKKPGVYELLKGDRVIDAITKADGFLDIANTSYINLSKKLEDEMVIIIYSNDEVDKFRIEDKDVVYIKYECACPDNINQACINEKDIVNTNGVEKKNSKNSNNNKSSKEDNLISINIATKEELMTLSGIGESKAEAIIKYREENGLFENLEDIMNVSGIGESAYTKIKDNIKL